MFKRIAVLAAVVVLCIACGMPVIHSVKTYSQPPDDLYSKMIVTLQELGWTIKGMDKDSLTILAERVTTGEAVSSAIFGGGDYPFQASIIFSKKDDGSQYSITITQPGKIMKINTVPKKLAEQIRVKFEEKL